MRYADWHLTDSDLRALRATSIASCDGLQTLAYCRAEILQILHTFGYYLETLDYQKSYMSPPNDPATESAKAAQEIAKTTSKIVDASREAGGFIARFVSGSLEQGMGIFEDRLRYMRWERQLRLMQRSEQVLKELGLAVPTRAVPLKIAIPLLQGASLEDNDELQDRWVNLLVNAANANSGIELQRVYIDILEQIGPVEARILDLIYALPFEDVTCADIFTGDLPNSVRLRTDADKDFLAPSEETTQLALGNLVRLGCLKNGTTWEGGEHFGLLFPTVLGRAFVRACRVQQPSIR